VPSISTLTFAIHLADSSQVQGRASRRIFVHNELLKGAKLYAGDTIAVFATSDLSFPEGKHKVTYVGAARISSPHLTIASLLSLLSFI